jgi:bromodomain-containing factor 1
MEKGYLSRTKITKVEKDGLLDIIRHLEKHKMSPCFLTPVNYEALGLLNYPEIIPRPMDLGTV